MKFVFAGNRFFVLEEILKLNIEFLKIYVVENSYLHKILSEKKINFELLGKKTDFLSSLYNLEFDFFISNGLPYILPISMLTHNNNKKFVNVHPSYLPDLRGADPQPGAILHGRDSGATCHLMDDKIDTGAIISQVKIPYSVCLDVKLLYQLTFLAEKEVFTEAFNRNFEPEKNQINNDELIYYTFKETDLLIDFSENAEAICRQIKAFNNKAKGCFFYFKGQTFKVYDAEIVRNQYLLKRLSKYADNQIALKYENNIILKKEDCFINFKNIEGNIAILRIGDNISGFSLIK